MKNLQRFLLISLFATTASAADTAYLFTYFTRNGESGLHLAWSDDGYKWQPVQEGRSFLTPVIGSKEKLMRDPCVVRGPDGTWHMVWTSGWWERGIGYASTKDFIKWSAQREIPVMAHEPTARNSWAPEIAYDEAKDEFVIFWATTIPGRYPRDTGASENDTNHRMYCTTTRDFETFTPTELFYDPGFNCIDATLLRTDDGLAIIIKDETMFPVAAKNLRVGPAAGPRGPFGPLGAPFTPPGMWVEGPSALKIGEDYVVYFDAYIEKHYRAMRSRDLVTWEDVTARMEFPFEGTPERMRHGTVIEVPRAMVDRLLDPAAAAAIVAVPAKADAVATIFIAGDSTAAAYNSGPLQGWGAPFEKYWDPALVKIDNRARGGRSARTFITEGLWDKLLADVKAGDFVLIQFGQNDGGAINEEPPGSTRPLRARGVLPGLGDESEEIDNAVTKKHEVVRTFGWYMRKMIAEVRERGATPIVMSPTVHNTWREGKVMRGPERFRMWNREVARAEGVAFVDHSRLIADEYQRLGEDAVRVLFPSDHVHTGPEGAELNARLVVAGLAGLRRSEFKKLLSEEGKRVKPDLIGWLSLPEPADSALPSIVLIGDSTVRNGGGDGADGQWGWGEPLAELIDRACANVVNRAIGGLSSRTFLTQGHWERALTLVKPGDWVLMQFGHNDGGPLNDNSRARGTIKGTGDEAEEIDNMLTGARETVHTYGWYLRHYIRETRERGAVPIVCTLVPRKTWKDGRIVRSRDGYAGWAAQVAEEEGAALIDLNEAIAARYDSLGSEAVDALFADAHTHTSRAGAELNAAIVAAALRQMDGFPCAAQPAVD